MNPLTYFQSSNVSSPHKVVILSTVEQKLRGLQGLPKFPKNHVYIFTDVFVGNSFHTRNCLFDMDIIPVDESGIILGIFTCKPGLPSLVMPLGTKHVVETEVGWAAKQGLKEGSNVFSYLWK